MDEKIIMLPTDMPNVHSASSNKPTLSEDIEEANHEGKANSGGRDISTLQEVRKTLDNLDVGSASLGAVSNSQRSIEKEATTTNIDSYQEATADGVKKICSNIDQVYQGIERSLGELNNILQLPIKQVRPKHVDAFLGLAGSDPKKRENTISVNTRADKVIFLVECNNLKIGLLNLKKILDSVKDYILQINQDFVPDSNLHLNLPAGGGKSIKSNSLIAYDHRITESQQEAKYFKAAFADCYACVPNNAHNVESIIREAKAILRSEFHIYFFCSLALAKNMNKFFEKQGVTDVVDIFAGKGLFQAAMRTINSKISVTSMDKLYIFETDIGQSISFFPDNDKQGVTKVNDSATYLNDHLELIHPNACLLITFPDPMCSTSMRQILIMWSCNNGGPVLLISECADENELFGDLFQKEHEMNDQGIEGKLLFRKVDIKTKTPSSLTNASFPGRVQFFNINSQVVKES